MRGVHDVVVGRLRHCEIGEVGGDALAVDLGRVFVAADPLHDVRRHVFEMTGRRHHAGQPLRRSDPLHGIGRGFHRVDVIVIGAGMPRVLCEHPFEDRDDLSRSGSRRAVLRPQFPRMDVHHRFGGHYLQVVVIRKPLRDRFHRLRVGDEDRSLSSGLERLCVRVTLCEGPDQRLLDRRCLAGVLFGLLQCLPGNRRARLRHFRQVLIRADGQRDAPVAHRARWIERRRLGERTRRLVMVERP